MKIAVNKIKNFEGYERTCQRCGKTIKHAYSLNNKGCYGSECIKSFYNINSKKIKEADNKIKLINNILNSSNGYRRKDFDFMTDEQIENKIQIHGRV